VTDESDPGRAVEQSSSPARGLIHRTSRSLGALVAAAVVSTFVGLGIAWLLGAFSGSKPPPVPEQVRAIERTERALHDGSLQNLQRNLALHGDGTRSWVFEFVEHRVWRLVIYDRENDRLRKGIEITNRMSPPKVPADFAYNKTRYSRLSSAQQRKARKEWLLLYSPHPTFETPVALPIADGSQVLLVPVSALKVAAVNEDTLRSTLVAVFWSADQDEYVLHRLSPVLDRWTVPMPTPLRVELRPGTGFETLPTATEVRIDKAARLVFAFIGGDLVQVHAFRLPLSPDDLEECPALWQGAAPIGPRSKLAQLEQPLVSGCPHV
jgi:hypothetical protein